MGAVRRANQNGFNSARVIGGTRLGNRIRRIVGVNGSAGPEEGLGPFSSSLGAGNKRESERLCFPPRFGTLISNFVNHYNGSNR
jgi:hypothetical protein